jgi:D-threo-aldose 1-dehydrogenase
VSVLSRLALGTAQFGLDYGVSNARGRVPAGEVEDILADARARGVDLLDTAAAYGSAEAVLGALPATRDFRVVTKTVRLAGHGVAGVAAAARASLDRLRRPRADALLVHAAADLAGAEGAALWAALGGLREEGLFERVGFSAYHADDPAALARRFRPQVVQLPVSLLDQRPVADGTLARLAADGVEIHARSVFLQGLVFLRPDRLPPHLAGAGPHLAACRARAEAAGVDLAAAALHYALGRPEIARVVVGVTSLAEWRALASVAERPPPDLDWPAFALDDPLILDPSTWAA